MPNREATIARNFKHGSATRAGLTPTYSSWAAAKARCYKRCNVKYPKYGGAGIVMCDRWRFDFNAFLADMGERPAGTTLDRIDPCGNYEPGNCRWATAKEQARNRRPFVPPNTRFLTHAGVTLSIPAWAKKLGMSVNLIHGRLRQGWTVEQTLTHELHPGRRPSDVLHASPVRE